MATSRINNFTQQLRRAVLGRDGAGLPDGQLLSLFVEQRDEAAFESLVHRHGPMVFGVCRRVLRDRQHAEDAFQATFLVLIRKAASIMPREMVANWLYGVAHTTALRMKALIAKQQVREKQVVAMPEPAAVQPDRDLWLDLQPLLDRELGRLPDKYRVPIVLCDLQGRSIKESARHLGWPQGTLAGRLARARKMLAQRLARQGLMLSAGSLGALVTQNAVSESVPVSVLSSTIKAATVVSTGQAAAGSVISVKVLALSKGVLKAMLVSKFKSAAMGLLMLSLIVFGSGWVTRDMAAQQDQAEKDKTKPSNLSKDSLKADARHKNQESEPNSGVFNLVKNVLSKDFKIGYADAYAGRIETFPAVLPAGRLRLAGEQSVLPASLDSVHRKVVATVSVTDAGNGCSITFKAVLVVAKPSPNEIGANAQPTEWLTFCRDTDLEDRLASQLWASEKSSPQPAKEESANLRGPGALVLSDVVLEEVNVASRCILVEFGKKKPVRVNISVPNDARLSGLELAQVRVGMHFALTLGATGAEGDQMAVMQMRKLQGDYSLPHPLGTAEAALKELQQNPNDKKSLELLERAIDELKKKAGKAPAKAQPATTPKPAEPR